MKLFKIGIFIFSIFIASFSAVQCAHASDSNSAVALVYHHVSSETPPSTSISPQKFEEHLQYLSENHKVISLDELLKHIKNKSIPDKSVVITFDDGYRNIKENGHPLLQKYQFPYTIFVNPVDVGKGSKMTWQELRELQAEGVTIGNHFWEHRHMLDQRGFDNQESWLSEMEVLLIAAQKSLKENLGIDNRYFAYPYGEFNQNLASLMEKHNLVAFAQHSGAIGINSPLTALPRFPAASIYSNLNTLKTKLASLAMPILSMEKRNFDYKGQIAPAFWWQLDTQDFHPKQFACYYNGERLTPAWEENKVSIEFGSMVGAGRHKINCTAPSKGNKGRFYWLSSPWFVSNSDGSWRE